MSKTDSELNEIDFIEIFTPMAKVVAYWHVHALGFSVSAYTDPSKNGEGLTSYVLTSGRIRLVLTSVYPSLLGQSNSKVRSFISENQYGVKRIGLSVASVTQSFQKSIENGAIPVQFPTSNEDEFGIVEEAAIKLYDSNEILFVDRQSYNGSFKPGYHFQKSFRNDESNIFSHIDHIASEVRINESNYWSNYLSNVLGTNVVQSIHPNELNKSGMILHVNQSSNRRLTFVISEPDNSKGSSKVQKNIDLFGPGIHHIAFATENMEAAITRLSQNGVEFVDIPKSYYDLLRIDQDLTEINVDMLEERGILIDKEGQSYLLQKFIKPIGDRPFFLYEIVQRVNGYEGFALKNINALKKAEEMEVQLR